jgi:hypothetical protein
MGFDNEPKTKMFDLVTKKFQHLELSKMLRFLRLLKTKEWAHFFTVLELISSFYSVFFNYLIHLAYFVGRLSYELA